jgi:hypothetical protein
MKGEIIIIVTGILHKCGFYYSNDLIIVSISVVDVHLYSYLETGYDTLQTGKLQDYCYL